MSDEDYIIITNVKSHISHYKKTLPDEYIKNDLMTPIRLLLMQHNPQETMGSKSLVPGIAILLLSSTFCYKKRYVIFIICRKVMVIGCP